jgi:solute carrier family 35 protein E1
MPSATLVVGITLWYAFNVGYNVYNKMLSQALDFPMLIALTSLGVGLLYFVPMWILGLRKAPKLTADDVKACTVLSMLHTVGHVGAVVAMSAGAVSFTHIIKALEPMFSVFFGYVLTGKIDSLKVNIWLVPIIAGVGWAAVGTKIMNGEDVFGDINPVAFGGAMTSNLAFSLRGLLSKRVKAESKSENLTSSNLYSVLTLISFFLFLPFALVLEGNKLAAAWPPVENLQAIPEKIMGVPTLSTEPLAFGYELVLWTGFFYYMYNEMAYLVLGEVSATAQAVANTVKRVVILLATVAFLGESMDQNKAAGAAVAIGATMLYSIAKSNAAKK